MEALRTKLDGLQWEVNRLDAENRRLRAASEDASRLVDLESEVEQAKQDVHVLTEELKECRGKLAGSEESATEACRRVEETVEQRIEMERQRNEAEETLQRVRDEVEEVHRRAEEASQSQEASSRRVVEVESELERVKTALAAQATSIERGAELQLYRRLEEERKKGDDREARLVAEIKRLEADLRSHVETPPGFVAEQVAILTEQLESERVKVTELEESNQAKQLEVEELRAEVTLYQARLRRRGDDVVGAVADRLTSDHDRVEGLPSSGDVCGHGTVALAVDTPPPGGHATETVITATSAPPSSSHATGVAPSATTASSRSVPPGTTPASYIPMGGAAPPTEESVPTPASSPAVPAAGNETTAATLGPAVSLLASATLPQIPRFTGEEDQDGELFQDWHERFESVAALAGWSGHSKLVHLMTRLRGPAFSFFKSCSPEQRSSYDLLVEALKKRFTPVRLTAVQSQIFHGRQQGPKETVDEYAQDLKRLFRKAYSGVAHAGSEAEGMGQAVLANQFISGLRPGLKAKIVGTEGDIERLLVKARFEEAKRRELDSAKASANPKKPVTGGVQDGADKNRSPRTDGKSPAQGSRTCFNCGMTGHLFRNCPYPKQKGDKEAEAKKNNTAANIEADTETDPKSQIAELRRKLYEAEVASRSGGQDLSYPPCRSDI